jgi:hypothetical protein
MSLYLTVQRGWVDYDILSLRSDVVVALLQTDTRLKAAHDTVKGPEEFDSVI